MLGSSRHDFEPEGEHTLGKSATGFLEGTGRVACGSVCMAVVIVAVVHFSIAVFKAWHSLKARAATRRTTALLVSRCRHLGKKACRHGQGYQYLGSSQN